MTELHQAELVRRSRDLLDTFPGSRPEDRVLRVARPDHGLAFVNFRPEGGTSEIQRTIIGERVLGLPLEPRIDKGLPWKDILRS